jgi:peptidoglycan/LPS O-acetylase OafA/YrhL
LGGVSLLGHTRADLLGGVPRTAFSFFAGVLLRQALPDRRLPTWVLPISVAVLLLTFLPHSGSTGWWYDIACIAFVYPIIIWTVAQVEVRGAARQVAEIAGALSFPVYILHYPIYFWVDQAVGGSRSMLVICAVFICCVSWLALKFFDEPVRRLLLSQRGVRRNTEGASS